ncbi:hypothetical protein COT48_05440, partial [Candidatus Woesearchaeota archaeon CG08_land_8_20_14_0_20_47_9]
MLLRSVKMENIRSYISEEIKLPSGSVMLSGDIGAGKSTVFLAVEFALFGFRPDLDGTSLLRNGAIKGSVQVGFEIDSHSVIIRRSLRRSRSYEVRQGKGFIAVDGVKSELTPSEIKARVLELLGYPKQLLTRSKALIYRYTVYTPQGDMNRILLDSSDSRIDILRRVFQIDKYKRIRENASILIKALRERRAETAGRISDLGEREEQRDMIRSELKGIEAELSGAAEELKRHQGVITLKASELRSIEASVSKLNELRQETRELQTSLREREAQLQATGADAEKARAQLDALKQRLDSIVIPDARPIHELEESLKQKDASYRDFIGKRSAALSQQGLIRSRLDDLKEEIALLENQVESLKTKQEALRSISKPDTAKYLEELSALEAHVKALEAVIQRSHALIEHSEATKQKINALDQCPLCMQGVSSSHKESVCNREDELIAAQRRVLEQKALERDERLQGISRLRGEIEAARSSEKAADLLKAEAENLKNSPRLLTLRCRLKEELLEKEKALTRDLAELSQEREEELKRGLAQLKADAELARERELRLDEKRHIGEMISEKKDHIALLEGRIKQLSEDIRLESERLQELKLRAEELGDVEGEYSRKKQDLDALKAQENELIAMDASIRSRHSLKSEALKAAEEEIAEKRRLAKRNHRLSQILHWVEEHFSSLMMLMEKQVMLNIHCQFDELFREWFEMLLEGALTARLDDSFMPITEQNGYELAVAALSGGEKTSCSLAYRLALNRVINNNLALNTRNFIALDEPTDGFSNQQLDRMRDVLDQLGLKQVIIVSHEQKIESFVES